MDDISKLMQKKMNISEEDRAKLDSYLRNQGMSPEKKNPFAAQVLKARQDASDTMLGRLLGVSPLSQEEKDFQVANRDPNLEKGMDLALQLGMGVGGINNISPKALSALKGGAFTGAAKEAVEQIPSRQMVPKTQNADEVSDAVIQQMLQQRKAESMAAALARKEMEYASPSVVGKEAQKLGQEITHLKNRTFKVLRED